VPTLSGKTFEIQTHNGDQRWIVVDIQETRSGSLGLAQNLLESGKYGGVRVVAESDRVDHDVIFEENVEGFDTRPIIINPIERAPICQNFADFFEFDARRTVARVLRHYLDRQELTALELMYDAMQIRMLENNDILFPQAVQQIARAQSREADIKPSKRADHLYAAVGRIREKAVLHANDDDNYQILKSKGVDALIAQTEGRYGVSDAPYFIRHAFARYLGDGTGWNSKIELLTMLAATERGDDELSEQAIDYIDDVLAEILDGVEAVKALLAGQPDAASAHRVLIKLCQGRVVAPANRVSCIEDVNNVIHRLGLARTRHVLLDRVACYLSGVDPLTKEGPEQDRKAFTQIVRDLTEIGGMMGGAKMCGAITQRARIAFSKNEENLKFADSIRRINNLIPHRAARIGYLVELSNAPIARKHKALILTALGKTVDQLTSLSALVPHGSSRACVRDAIAGLRMRLTSDDLPDEWRKTLSSAFDTLMAKPESHESEVKSVVVTDDEYNAMLAEKPVQKEASKGEILFEEGDLGDEAYLVLDGEIEIFQKVGNAEHVIATLGTGEILGEMSLIDNQPRMASARVLGQTNLLVISQASLKLRLQKLHQDDRVLRRLIDVLVNRLRGDAQAGV